MQGVLNGCVKNGKSGGGKKFLKTSKTEQKELAESLA